MPSKIAVEQVTVRKPVVANGQRQDLTILSDVSFAIPPGGRLAIVGPSGSGKTSLLRLLNRLEDPVDGRVLLDGADLRTLDPIAVRRRVGMVFQQTFLFDQTVEQNLAYPSSLIDRSLSREQAADLLREVGLPEDFLDRQGQQLSGGQQQRVAIARALSLEPEVLLLDEPTSALDEDSARIVMDALLKRNAQTGLTLIVITHTPEMLRRMTSPTLLVHDSRADEYPDAESALASVSRERIRLE